MTLKYGLVLSKREPAKYMRLVSTQALTDDQKEQLSAILL